MIFSHWLELYLAGALIYARVVNPWTRLSMDDLLIPLLFWWVLVPLIVASRLIPRRTETLADYGGREAAEQLKKDLTGSGD